MIKLAATYMRIIISHSRAMLLFWQGNCQIFSLTVISGSSKVHVPFPHQALGPFLPPHVELLKRGSGKTSEERHMIQMMSG